MINMVDEFINNIEYCKFRSTNSLWNNLRLNSPWSVGYVTFLIEQISFKNKEDWEEYYYNTGKERLLRILKLPSEQKNLLNDFLLQLNYPEKVNNMDSTVRELNFNFGRTKEDLSIKGQVIYKELEKTKNEYKLTLDECIECVRFRVICETWNGVILREHNTLEYLRSQMPELIFKKTEADFDHDFAVDYEIFENSILLCGLQIKPKSYKSHAPFLEKAKSANHKKNNDYKGKTGKDVFYIYSEKDGSIVNNDIIYLLKKLK